ncbi:MAG: hypothetical protein LAO06_11835 [Acidobacteriia bacterium]|nr:hypothetical protein [Terriglobia bacterium]
MAKKKDDQWETVTVDGEEYRWQRRHGWVVDMDVGIKGISISVWLEPGKTRELIVDFPFSVYGLDRSPKRAALIAALSPAIKAAIDAGWRPESRGRTFRFNVPCGAGAPVRD